MIPYHRPMSLDDPKLMEAIGGILRNGMLTNDEWCRMLEDKIKDLYHVDYCNAFCNGTQALKACFHNAFTNGSIETSAFAWPSPFRGFNVYLDDIDPQTWLVNQERSPFTFVPIHTFGSVMDIPESDDYVIFDGAHALGSQIRNIGDATVFSLAATKLVTGCEGGLLITNDKSLYLETKSIRDKEARLSEVHAVIALYTLSRINEMLQWKWKVAHHYIKRIPGEFQAIPFNTNYNTIGFVNTESLKIPEEIEYRQYYQPLKIMKHAWHVYKNIICLPSFYGCPYEYITEEILKINE